MEFQVNSFTQSYGSDDMDASNLLMESYGFLEANDSKYIGTVDATQKELDERRVNVQVQKQG
jgi:alpha,alpha-trehalase